MSLVRLIYVSRMTDDCDMEAIQKILETSRFKNTSLDITGLLCYDPAFFIQCLEGPRGNVNALYRSIAQDKRHTDVLLLEYSEVDRRLFEEWSMAFVAMGDVNKQLLAKYTGSGKFDPYRFTAEHARDFLTELAEYHTSRLDV